MHVIVLYDIGCPIKLHVFGEGDCIFKPQRDGPCIMFPYHCLSEVMTSEATISIQVRAFSELCQVDSCNFTIFWLCNIISCQICILKICYHPLFKKK